MIGQSPFHSFPDSDLVDMLSRLALDDLLRLDRDFTRWCRLQDSVLRGTVTLTVVVGSNAMLLVDRCGFSLPDYCEWVEPDRAEYFGIRSVDSKCLLKFESLEQVNSKWLTSLMPNIQKLMLIYTQVEPIAVVRQVTALLQHWRDSLVHLTLLWGCSPAGVQEMSPVTFTPLFDCINMLPRLKHLSLEIWNKLPGEQLELPILARLEEFQFYSFNDKTYLTNSLQQYAVDNDSLQRVLLNELELPAFLYYDAKLCFKVTRMIPQDGWEPSENPNDHNEMPFNGPLIELICDKFCSLTHLRIRVREYTSLQLTTALAKLSRLYYLELNIERSLDLLIGSPCSCCCPPAVKDAALPEGPQLISVRVLRLSIGQSYHHEDLAHAFHIGHFFPNLVMAEVEEHFQECESCRLQKLPSYATGLLNPGWTRVDCRPDACRNQLMSPFQDCRMLRKLIHIHQGKVTDLSDTFRAN